MLVWATLIGLLPFLSASPVHRIIGGTDASILEYPWQAALFYGAEGFTCGASLISPQWVLTAAHCVEFSNPDNPILLQVHLGQDDLLEPYVIIGASAVFVHPGWENNDNVSNVAFPNDIALIKLEAPAPVYDSRITPIQVIADNQGPVPYPDSDCMISGWGKTEGGIHLPPRILQQAPTHVISTEECLHQFSMDGHLISPGQICLIDRVDGTSPCSGDSGGPLTCFYGLVQEHPELCGVTSYGIITCPVSSPAVYTRVSYYKPWINGIVAANP